MTVCVHSPAHFAGIDVLHRASATPAAGADIRARTKVQSNLSEVLQLLEWNTLLHRLRLAVTPPSGLHPEWFAGRNTGLANQMSNGLAVPLFPATHNRDTTGNICAKRHFVAITFRVTEMNW